MGRVLDDIKAAGYRLVCRARLNTCWNASDRNVAAGHGGAGRD